MKRKVVAVFPFVSLQSPLPPPPNYMALISESLSAEHQDKSGASRRRSERFVRRVRGSFLKAVAFELGFE